jgi:hypothetical protein
MLKKSFAWNTGRELIAVLRRGKRDSLFITDS